MPVTVGCDPEFLVVDISTSRSTIPFNINQTLSAGNIGNDHGGRVGEFRPKHGTPAEVTENLRKMILWVKEHYPSYKIVAGGGGGYGESIGGHIHFGNIGHTTNYFSATRICNRHRTPQTMDFEHSANDKLVWALDFYLGRRLKKVPGGKRSGSHYGRPCDVESKAHGFEYRTPPSWISDPILTEATLAIAKQITELWKIKQSAYDELIRSGKRSARKRDYDILIPASGREREYILEQIRNFRSIAFSKTYNMASPDVIDKWTNPIVVAADPVSGTRTRRTRVNRSISLQVCQLKNIDWRSQFQSEEVLKVCRFAVPEVKIYAFSGRHTPWSLFNRSLKLRESVIYISQDLRKYFKFTRGRQFKVRYFDLSRRTVNGMQPVTNTVLYNTYTSNTEMLRNEILNIFETCVRTKLRRSDAEPIA